MTAVILFSHGSLICGAGEQLEGHAARLREKNTSYAAIEIGYLNYSQPTFFQAVTRCAAAGATEIVIAPFFLIDGYFVQSGLPKVLAPAREAFPHLKFLVAPALEDHPDLAQALLQCAQRATRAPYWRAVLHAAPQYCESDENCPLHGRCEEALHNKPVQREEQFLDITAGDYALLVMVHGSPHAAANDSMFRVVEQLRERRLFSNIAVGFMECNTPNIPTAIENLVQGGANKIIAVPYFLHAGKHVANDLPALLEKAQEQHLAVEFLLGDYLGREPLITEVLLARVQEAQPISP